MKRWQKWAIGLGVGSLLFGVMVDASTDEPMAPVAHEATTTTEAPTTTTTVPPTTTTTTTWVEGEPLPADLVEEVFVFVVRDYDFGAPTWINASNDEQLVAVGYEVCNQLDDGLAVLTVMNGLVEAIHEQFWTPDAADLSAAAYFVGASIGAFCDEYTDSFNKPGTSA